MSKKGGKDPNASSPYPLVAATAPGEGAPASEFLQRKAWSGQPDCPLAPGPPSSRLPRGGPASELHEGLVGGGVAGGSRTRPGGPVPGAGRALHLSPRAPAPPGPHRGGSPAQPSEALGPQPARRAPGTRSSRAPAGRTGSSPSPPPPPRRVGEARRAGNRGRQHLELPRRVISTGWERSVF